MNFLPFAKPTIDEETIAGVADVLRSGWITSGPKVQEFEQALSDYLGGRIVRTFTSATGALEVALQACGIGPGHEVIVPAMTFAASANVVMRVGAKPVFVDVELSTRNLDPARLEAAITPQTRAIMPVHFAGLAVDMDRIYDVAEHHHLRVIEDAAHAIGTRWNGKRIGSFGDLVSFSFHPNKNMTTIEGGALSLPSDAELKAVELQRFHGLMRHPDGSADVLLPGGKYNLSDVAARIGLSQLKQLEGFNDKRRVLVARYFERMKTDPPCLLPSRGDDGHTWHIFAPLLPLDHVSLSRGEFIKAMHERGIGVGVHYPALHLFTAYRQLGYKEGDFPNAEKIGRETVTLPLFPTMELSDVDRVCDAVAEVLAATKIGHR
jgi:dTDP-4-amino-4,6-dideoxygalactose transaminase